MGQQAAPTHPILSEPLVSVKTPCLRKHTLVVGSMGQAHSLLDGALGPHTTDLGEGLRPRAAFRSDSSVVARVRTDQDSCQGQVGTEEVDAPC